MLLKSAPVSSEMHFLENYKPNDIQLTNWGNFLSLTMSLYAIHHNYSNLNI